MQHFWSLEGVHLDHSWLSVGSFDGVHRGHQEIIRRLVDGAHQESVPSVVLTFSPHPAVVLGRRSEPFLLTSPEERANLLGEMGVDFVITHPFNREVASKSAHDFMERLCGHLGVRTLCVGHDFALGRQREGNVARLRELGEQFGYQLQVIPAVMIDDEPLSSSRIRARLAEGDVKEVARLIGRPYRMSGEVVPGDGRGKLIGVPTANMDILRDRMLPKAGVYVCRANVNGVVWGAVTNIGVRPTFTTLDVLPRVETHILNLDRDLYGELIGLDFLAYLRGERRFASVEALVEQIQLDIHQARSILE